MKLAKLQKNTQEIRLSEGKKGVSACHNLLDLLTNKNNEQLPTVKPQICSHPLSNHSLVSSYLSHSQNLLPAYNNTFDPYETAISIEQNEVTFMPIFVSCASMIMVILLHYNEETVK